MKEIDNNTKSEIIKELNNNVIESLIGWKEFPDGQTYETTLIKYFDMWLVESEHPDFKRKILKTTKSAVENVIKMSDIDKEQLDICFDGVKHNDCDWVNIYGYVWDYLPYRHFYQNK